MYAIECEKIFERLQIFLPIYIINFRKSTYEGQALVSLARQSTAGYSIFKLTIF